MARIESDESRPLLDRPAERPRSPGRRPRVLVLPRLLRDAAKSLANHESTESHAFEILSRWRELQTQGGLERKETSLRPDFLNQVFGEALGYKLATLSPNQFQFEHEFAVPNVGQADAALGNFAPDAPRDPHVVIEVKDAATDLDRDRFAGRTPVQQCWDYLNALPNCRFGIVTNFITFRLYYKPRGTLAHQEFKLEELGDRQRFREFFVLFERGGLLPTPLQAEPTTLRLIRESENRQREVGDELYDLYSGQRRALIHHLNKREGKSLDLSIHIAQKIIDRIVFVAFCEDRNLLNRNTIESAWKDIPPFSRVRNPRWQNFINLFRSIDAGNERHGIPPYNGGLFREDPEVDDLQLDDVWTGFFKEVGDYDFSDEVNVDVLGHLFERSVTELEKIRIGGLFGEDLPDDTKPAEMPKSAQRKRFGIYYTPPEFTDFLVRATIDELLRERYADAARSLDLNPDEETALDASRDYWSRCLAILRNLKVCDPACGSGAFLIRAYDVLEEHHERIIDKLAALRHPDADDLADSVYSMILNENLFGVDLSPEAVEITQLALWIRSARRGKTLADLSRNILCGNSLVDDRAVDPRAMNWASAFPAVFDRPDGGFDCVIGNPPWERLKLQEREFFSASAPNIAAAVSAADRRRKIAALEKKDPELFARYNEAKERADRMLDYVRRSDRFPLTGKGDVNTYALFAEFARRIVSPAGKVGILVPSGIATDHTTRAFFNDLMTSQALVSLHDYENKRPFFPDVHRSFKFCTLVMNGSARKTEQADFFFFARDVDDLKDRKRHIPLTAADLHLVNRNTRTCPVFRTRKDAELTRRIYKRVPILIDRTRRKGGNPWGIKFVRMFDQTNDAELFHDADKLKEMGFKRDGNRWKKGKQIFLPLYEAKMVQAYDHRAAGVVIEDDNWMRQGQKNKTARVFHENPEFTVEPRWWVEQNKVNEALEPHDEPVYLCYKDVTSPTNRRTMIAAFIPKAGVVNSAPLILLSPGFRPRLACCFLANLNSHVLDYVARQKVGNVHLNFFIVEQLPIIDFDSYEDRCPWDKRSTLEKWISERVLKLTCTADDMLPLAKAADFKPGIHKWKERERAELTADLDAAYFHLYGLSRDDAEYVLSTFAGVTAADRERILKRCAELASHME